MQAARGACAMRRHGTRGGGRSGPAGIGLSSSSAQVPGQARCSRVFEPSEAAVLVVNS
jgi:hypothetical protein